MIRSKLTVILILIILPLLLISCPGPVQKDFYASVQEIYLDLEENQYNPENAGQTMWPYSYHMMLHAAWVFKSQGNADSKFERDLRDGNEIFWQMHDEIERQIDEGYNSIDEETLFGLIEDEEIKSATINLYETENLTPLNAFTRVFSEGKGLGIVLDEDGEGGTYADDILLVLLGQLYTDRPDLCELPLNPVAPDDDSRWRDWLHRCLGASEYGCQQVIEWNNQLENLQELVPDEPFWDGRLTHAFTLRSLQMGESNALQELLEYTETNIESGPGFAKWAYWNLAFTAYAGTSMAPYTQEDIDKINTFLFDGLKTGGTNEGEEAWVVADALGRAPSTYYAEQLFNIIDDESTSCDLRQLCYTSLGNMFFVDPDMWVSDLDVRKSLKEQALTAISDADTSCGLIPVLDLIKGVTTTYYPYLYGDPLEWELNHDDLVIINEAFRNFAPEINTTDERVRALDLLLTTVGQADFLIFYDDADDYHAFLLGLYEEWTETTDYDDSEHARDDVENLLRLFNNSLGNWDLLDRYLEEVDE